MQIQTALQVANRAVSFRDAEVLLGHVLKLSREQLLAHPQTTLTKPQEAAYTWLLDQREAGHPVAYLTGVKEFYGRLFKCDARALIPRPETEAVIELCLKHSLAFTSKGSKSVKVLELGTGVGNIAVTLALELPDLKIIATDLSSEALELAEENRKLLAAPAITWLEADLFDHPKLSSEAPFQIITANLPYVHNLWKVDPQAQPDVVFFEPDLALFGGPDGLDLYRLFFKAAPRYLDSKGVIIVEHDAEQGKALTKIAQAAFPKATIKQHQDYAQLDRVLEILT